MNLDNETIAKEILDAQKAAIIWQERAIINADVQLQLEKAKLDSMQKKYIVTKQSLQRSFNIVFDEEGK